MQKKITRASARGPGPQPMGRAGPGLNTILRAGPGAVLKLEDMLNSVNFNFAGRGPGLGLIFPGP